MNILILQQRLTALCKQVACLSKTRRFKIVTAESCTAGLICASLTNLPGASDYVEGGFVTYSNAMKQSCLNVSHRILQEFGAVSEQTVHEMVQGALNNAHTATSAIAVTGIAGPTGGSTHKPVGLVWIAIQNLHEKPVIQKNMFYGNRDAIRLQTAIQAISLFINTITV